VLTKADDYPIHQRPEPIMHAGKDRNFYDRYFFNGYTKEGQRFFALVLGLIAGIFEILPYVGPILGAIPAIVVALLADPWSALWVAIAFFGIQQVENLVLVPRISGESVKLHPAMVMVVLVVGNELAGFWGMLIAVPVTAVLRDVFKYLYLRFLDEPLNPEEAMTNVRSGQEVQLGV